MNAKQIRKAVNEARENHGFIAISRYRSENGRIANITLQPLGADGYHNLIRKSLEQVEAGNVDKPNGINQAVWDQAVEEQCASWRKTLSGGHNRKNKFTKDAKGFYTHEEQGDIVTIRNVRIVRKDVLVEGDCPATKSRPLTVAKKLLVGQTPVYYYQGSFKLKPEKFDRIRFNRTEIEGQG
jgi:hypothetical protein